MRGEGNLYSTEPCPTQQELGLLFATHLIGYQPGNEYTLTVRHASGAEVIYTFYSDERNVVRLSSVNAGGQVARS